MRKQLIAVTAGALIACVSFGAYAETNASISVAPSFSWGEANSFVYSQNTLLSKLDWPMQPVWSANVRGAFEHDAFKIDARLSMGVPWKSGTMYDSDYVNLDATKTNLSVHEGYLEFLLDGQIRIGGSLRSDTLLHTPFRLEIDPYASFRYMNCKWTGRNGYTQYGTYNSTTKTYSSWDGTYTKTNLYGTIIAYQQEYIIPLMGVDLVWYARPELNISAGIEYTPLLFCNALDNHLYYTKPIDYYDTLSSLSSGGFYVNPQLAVTWNCTPKTALSVAANWTIIKNLAGSTIYRKNDTGTIYQGGSYSAGAAFSAATVRIGLESRLN